MFCLLQWNKHLAKKRGLLQKRERVDRTVVQSIIHYVIEFDREYSVLLLPQGAHY